MKHYQNQETMKAVICPKYGPPEVLQLAQIPKPVPRKNELLIQIKATAVNSGDVRVRGLAVTGFMKTLMRFVLGFSKPKRPVLGNVFSGVVASVDTNVTKFNVGDRVFGMTGLRFGTYAEYLALNQKDNIYLMPENATYEEAAALIFGGQAAIYFLYKANISQRLNQNVLIVGATGSVGNAALQIASYYGANITAVCSSAGHGILRKMGVKQVIFYDKIDFTKYPGQFDLIFDAVGHTSKKQCSHLLSKNGTYINVNAFDYASESIDQLKLLKELFEKDQLKAVIDKFYAIDNIVEAHRYVDTGRKKGNVVITFED